MADRRDLRKQNQALNQSNPSPPVEPRGSLGRRDPNTGKYSANLDNDGTLQATRQFNSSVRSDTEVQLNQKTKTADYKSVDRDRKQKDGARKEEAVKPASGNPTPQFTDLGDGSNNPDDPQNPYFGNCGSCQGLGSTRIDCPSGYGRIEFSDDDSGTFKTPALIEYGSKVKFRYQLPEGGVEEVAGVAGELYVKGCGQFTIDNGTEDLEAPYSDAVYGKMIYQRAAGSASFGAGSTGGIKEFQIYQDGCAVKIVGIKQEGGRQVFAETTCDNLAGIYTGVTSKDCIQLGDKRACGVDLDSLEFFCVIRIYRLCNQYVVRWVKESTGETVYAKSCDPIGYRIELIEEVEPFPLGDSGAYGRLRYDSGIQREFVVRSGGQTYASGSDYGYFQIYQKSTGFLGQYEPCTYQVVGWKEPRYEGFYSFDVIGPDGTILDSGVDIAGESRVVYEGGCGFEIELGNYLTDQVLRIYDAEGELAYETGDFVASSVQGCSYIGGTGLNARFEGDGQNVCRTGEEVKVLEYEREFSSDEEIQLAVTGLSCIEESQAIDEKQIIEFSDESGNELNNGN